MNMNPSLIRFFAMKFTNRARGEKVYRVAFDGPGTFAKVSRKNHKTKSAALTYGWKVLDRWHKLYNAMGTEEVKS